MKGEEERGGREGRKEVDKGEEEEGEKLEKGERCVPR
jgi:hypothetical protein